MSDIKFTDFFLSDATIPVGEGYAQVDVLLAGGNIAKIAPAGTLSAPTDAVFVDCTKKMLLPGLVNAHTHSIQQWGRGLVQPLPLELWLPQSIKHGDPRGRDPQAAPHVVYLSALFAGVDTLMSGGTAIMDHLVIRDLEDVGAACAAYKQLGLRATVAPMLGDLARTNYVSLVLNAADRNAAAKAEGKQAGGLEADGSLREGWPEENPAETARVLKLWEDAVKAYHRPEEGVSIAIGPLQVTSASQALIEGAVALRKKYGVAGHIHLLETRSQRLHSRLRFPEGGSVKWLDSLGWLSLPATSCAHSVWLEEEEVELMAARGVVAVHNPVANCRLGSGIAPISSYLAAGLPMALGCDGPASNDSQNMFEVMKMACILSPLTTPEYRDWVTPRKVLQLATEGGAKVLGLSHKVGKLEEGFEADLALYDLTALSLLPQNDPISMLVYGRPGAGVAGNALHSVWCRGRLILTEGAPVHLDLGEFRKEVMAYQSMRTTDITHPKGDGYEVEYRASMGLQGKAASTPEQEALLKGFPKFRVAYDADYC